jgi:DNA-binding MurR/RpiR family transcriptional regulator
MDEPTTYRDRIRIGYDLLSRSYRKVADFILTNYYDVSFMTAAQLAYAVGVDTTTVVRFSQRLGYNGYPELLNGIRGQVKAEIYASYVAPATGQEGVQSAFRERIERDRHTLGQLLVHNPPEHVERVGALLAGAAHILLLGEGMAAGLAESAAQQLRQAGLDACAASADPVQLAALLAAMAPGTLVVGLGTSEYGREVARAMEFARSRGAATIGVVGSLHSQINRMSDLVVYAPADGQGALHGLVALTAALSALAAQVAGNAPPGAAASEESVAQLYAFLVQPEVALPDEEEA